MNPTINSATTRAQGSASRATDAERATSLHAQIGADVASVRLPPAPPAPPSVPASAWQSPPRPAQPATLEALVDALNRLASSFVPLKEDGQRATWQQSGDLSVDEQMAYVATLCMSTSAVLAEIKTQQMKVRTDAGIALREKQLEVLHQQLAKAIEDQKKAESGTTRSRWIRGLIAVAELACGVAKVFMGMHLSAATDLIAGACGLASLACEMAAGGCEDEETAQSWKTWSTFFATAQQVLEGASMTVDALSLARTVQAIRSVGSATRTVLEKGAGEALASNLARGSAVGAEVGKSVATQVAAKIQAGFGQQALKAMGNQHLTTAFCEAAIEQMVARAVESTAKKVAKSGVETCAKKLTDQIVKAAYYEGASAATRVTTRGTANFLKNTTYSTLTGGNLFGRGLNGFDRAALQKEIQDLLIEGDFLRVLFDETERVKKHARKEINARLEEEGTALESAAQVISARGAQVRNALNTIG